MQGNKGSKYLIGGTTLLLKADGRGFCGYLASGGRFAGSLCRANERPSCLLGAEPYRIHHNHFQNKEARLSA
jgi:hypothetical protein